MSLDQKTLNELAQAFFRSQTLEVAKMLRTTLTDDVEERSKDVSGPTLHHIHNMGLFECLVWLNATALRKNDASDETFDGYLRLADTLAPKFMDIVEALKDFQPTE